MDEITNHTVDALPILKEQFQKKVASLPTDLRLELFSWLYILMNPKPSKLTNPAYQAHIPAIMLNFLHVLFPEQADSKSLLSYLGHAEYLYSRDFNRCKKKEINVDFIKVLK